MLKVFGAFKRLHDGDLEVLLVDRVFATRELALEDEEVKAEREQWARINEIGFDCDVEIEVPIREIELIGA